ncbi:MAG: undecaprenyl-phosphate glucose phosphotransferase [Gammaproteobacteria bacterium]|nr:undecaprenyl-phosphate glucose phosphotransferase [Gammaproteobacteria bacterium]
MSAALISNNHNSFSSIFRLTDIAIITGSMLIVCYLLDVVYNNNNLLQTVLAISLFLLFSESMELHRSWRTDTITHQITVTLVCWGMVSGTLAFILIFTSVFHASEVSKETLHMWLLSCTVALPAWRLFTRVILHIFRAHGNNSRSAIILGATASGLALARSIKNNPHMGINLVGFCDDRNEERMEKEHQELDNNKYIGDINYAIDMANHDRIDNIYIAMPMSAEKRIQEILRLCGNTTATVHIIPSFFTYNLINSRLSRVGDVQTLSVYDTPINGLTNWTKRMEDLVLSTLIIAVTSIPMLIIAAIIKLTSKGPVLFMQDRYGLSGNMIKVWKFRSMTNSDNGDIVIQAKKNDARITPFGSFLRRTSLDELPQFFNVLAGTMSVVGPRPHAVAHNEKYREEIGCYMLRHKVKPGITGWAQINGWRGETETLDKMQKRIEFDLDYMRNWSVFFDLKIVFMTVFKGFIGKHVY